MPLDLRQNRGPVDERDPTFRDVLMDLQGNILDGHGRDHAVHLFIHFNKDRIHDVKRWISKFAGRQVTSAFAQVEQAVAYREHGVDAGVFGHFALSAAGYRALGFADEHIPLGVDPRNRKLSSPPPDLSKGDYSNVFAAGMASRQPFLLDVPQADWENGYKNPHKPIHAMVLLAADDPAELAAIERGVTSELQHDGMAEVLAAERGLNLRKIFHPDDGPDGVSVEHFGYIGIQGEPPRHWPAAWGKPTVSVETDFARFVTLKGGEYLFAPSVGFLNSLSTR